jgi:hypothetical protein
METQSGEAGTFCVFEPSAAERFSLARPSPTTPGAQPAAGPSLALIAEQAGRDPRGCAGLSADGDPAARWKDGDKVMKGPVWLGKE